MLHVGKDYKCDNWTWMPTWGSLSEEEKELSCLGEQGGKGGRLVVKVLNTQLRPTLCDPMDCSPPVSSVHEILQARILEWVAIPFSRVSSPPRGKTQVSCIAGNFFTIWATREAPLIVLSKINLQFQGYSTSFLETYPQNCGSLCHSYSLVIM